MCGEHVIADGEGESVVVASAAPVSVVESESGKCIRGTGFPSVGPFFSCMSLLYRKCTKSFFEDITSNAIQKQYEVCTNSQMGPAAPEQKKVLLWSELMRYVCFL